MGPRVEQILFLILSVLISAALCRTHDEPIVSDSALKSLRENDEGTSALKFVYMVEDPETKIPCTMANMSISIALSYTTKKNTVIRKQVKIPSDAMVTGTCKPMVSEMSLVWSTRESDRVQQNVIKFVLFNDRTNFSVFSVDVDLFLDSANFPDAADERRTTWSKIDLGLFDAPVENGLHNCPMERLIKVDNDTTLITSKVSFIAFNTKKDYGQREEIICDDKTYTKVFPVAYEDKYAPGVLLLARMSFSLEIPYLTKNYTIAKYTMANLTKPSTVFGYVYRHRIDDTLTGYISLYFMPIDLKTFVHIYVYFDQDVDGTAYVTGVDVTYRINNETLPDAKLIECNSHPRLTTNDFNYALEDKNRAVPCVLANMTISMKIPYNKIHSMYDAYANITVPPFAKVSGFCGDSVSKMELTWPAEDAQLNSVALFLSRDLNFSVFHVETDIYTDNTSFPNIRDKYMGQWERHRSNSSLNMFVGPKNNGWYNCPEHQEIIRVGEATITISNVSLIAFNDQEELNTKQTFSCIKDADKTIKPHPSEANFEYVVRDEEKNVACIVANMSMSVTATYTTTSHREAETTFVVPKDKVTVTGNCNCRNPELTLEWYPEEHYKSSITLTFGGDKFDYYLHEIMAKFDLNKKNFPNASGGRVLAFKKKLDLFSGYIGSMYTCGTEIVADLGKVQLTFNNVSVTAFNKYRNVSDLWTRNCYTAPSPTYSVSLPIILASIVGGVLVGSLIEENCSSVGVGPIVGSIIGGLMILGIIGCVVLSCRRSRY